MRSRWAGIPLHSLRNHPGFAAVAILVLALGIGVNVAVFSVVNTILLRPLPFPDSQKLVWIAPPPSKCGQSCATYSTDAYDTFRAGTHSFGDVTGYNAFSTADNLSLSIGAGAPVQATSIDVIANFFQLLGEQRPHGSPSLRTTACDRAPRLCCSLTPGSSAISSTPTRPSSARPST